MTIRIIFSHAAAADIAGARDWYEEQREGLGKQFLDAIESSLNRIAAGPERFRIVSAETRRALVSKFPYSIYFLRQGECVRIIAVVHQHRDPRVWQHRSGGR